MKFLIMQSSPASHHFFPLRSRYSPQHPILKHPQSVFFFNVRDQVSHPYKTTDRIRRFLVFMVVKVHVVFWVIKLYVVSLVKKLGLLTPYNVGMKLVPKLCEELVES
jgi:hypothetical protein